ncbi:unnamed protein product, partial [marine sediment metagenome]
RTRYAIVYDAEGEEAFKDYSAKSRSEADQIAFRMMIKYGEYKQ